MQFNQGFLICVPSLQEKMLAYTAPNYKYNPPQKVK